MTVVATVQTQTMAQPFSAGTIFVRDGSEYVYEGQQDGSVIDGP